MTDTAADEIEGRLRAQIAGIENAIDDTRQDRLRDLSHLDGEVAGLCREIAALSPPDAAQMAPPIAEMIGRLEMLIGELESFRDRVLRQEEEGEV